MITNQPTEEDFERVTIECLTQAFNLLFKVYQNYQEYDEDIHEDVEMEDIWNHNVGTIRTSTILLHQAVESFMKSVICRTSPLLLIEKNRADWPTLPMKTNKDFDSLYTISGESLVATFCAVESELIIDNKLIEFIEKIRQNRNKSIHGASNIEIKPTELLDDILNAFTYFFGKDKWFLHITNFNLKNPLFGYYDWEFEDAITYEFLDFVESVIGRKKMNKHHETNIIGRRYHCPICKDTIDAEYGEMNSKWTFLHPNTPSSENVHCLNCDGNYKVTRENCTTESCKGNVISFEEEVRDKFCLSCFQEQEE